MNTAFFGRGESMAWTGKSSKRVPNSREAMEYAGLDFRVERRTMFTSKRTLIPRYGTPNQVVLSNV